MWRGGSIVRSPTGRSARRGLGIAVGLALFVGVAAPADADAQSADHARRLYLDADFEGAAEEFDDVLERPSLDPGTGAEAHRYLAVLRALLGDEDAARRHAEIAVALDPAVTAPEGAPPWVADAMESARGRFGGRAAALELEGQPEGTEYRVRATLAPAPEGLVEQLSLRCVSGEAEGQESAAPPSVELVLEPEAPTVHCRASAVTSGGAPLIGARAQLSVPAAGGGTAAPAAALAIDDEDEGGSAWPWIAVGGGVLVAGAAVAAILLVSAGGDVAEVGAPRTEGW